MAECEEEMSNQMGKNENAVEETDSENEDEFYEVEKIVGKSKTNRKCMYKVRWRGYGPADDTWEPVGNLEICLDLIEEFEKERENLKSKRHEERKKRKAMMLGTAVPSSDKSSSDENIQFQENVSTLKDTFWKDLEDGKVNVFATDMYSKVKGQGRASKPPDLKNNLKRNKTPTSTDEPKSKQKKLINGSHDSKSKKRETSAKKKKHRNTANRGNKKKETSKTQSAQSIMLCESIKRDESSNQSSSGDSNISAEHAKSCGDSVLSLISSSEEGCCKSSLCPQSDDSSCLQSESVLSVSQGEPSEMTTCSQTDSVVTNSQDIYSVEETGENSEEDEYRDMPKLGHFDISQEHKGNVDKETITNKKKKKRNREYTIISDTSESDTDISRQKNVDIEDIKAQKLIKVKPSNIHKPTLDHPIKKHCSPKLLDNPSTNQLVKQSSNDACASLVCLNEPIKKPLFDSKKQLVKKRVLVDGSFCNSSMKSSGRTSPNINSKMTKHPETTPRDKSETGRKSSLTQDPDKNASVSRRKDSIDIPVSQPLDNILNSTFLPLLPESTKSHERGDDLGFEIELDDLDWEQFEQETCEGEPLIIPDDKMREAILEGDFPLVQRALSSSKVYDVDQVDSSETTLLMHAARQGYDDIAELLILSGANIDGQQKNGTTALMLGCEEAHICTVSLLVEFGANINLVQNTGETALMKAARRGHKQIVKFLLENGANFSDYSAQGNTALAYANLYNNTDVEEILNEHIVRLKTEFDKQVCITLNNTARIICGLFPLQCFPLSENNKLVIPFKHALQPMMPGVGYLLFIAHARITGQEVKCRFYGQCAVKSAFLNGVQQPSLTEEANFVMSFCPLNHGRNEIIIHTIPAPTSKVKLVVCAYKAQLLDPACQKNTATAW